MALIPFPGNAPWLISTERGILHGLPRQLQALDALGPVYSQAGDEADHVFSCRCLQSAAGAVGRVWKGFVKEATLNLRFKGFQ